MEYENNWDFLCGRCRGGEKRAFSFYPLGSQLGLVTKDKQEESININLIKLFVIFPHKNEDPEK